MARFATLRRVLANLRDGLPAEAVRTDAPVPASAAYHQRLQAQAATDAWLQTVQPAVPAHLQAVLMQCTDVHDANCPVTSLPGLQQAAAQRRAALLAELDRGGIPRTAAQQALLDDLAALLALLPQLTEYGPADLNPPATR